jgi:hypothetical protein
MAEDLGSGLITNAGVLALAQDALQGVEAKKELPFNLFANLKYHAWGSKKAGAMKIEDIELEKFEVTSTGAGKATAATTTTVTAVGTGEPKIVSTSKLKAEGSLEIVEWGIFCGEKIETTPGTGKFVSVTAGSGKASGAVFTASTTEIKGERLNIAEFAESEDGWGLITSNTTEVLTVPAWYKTSTGGVKEPTGISAYVTRPLMFDRRTYAPINVEVGNTIEYPWELTIKSGG